MISRLSVLLTDSSWLGRVNGNWEGRWESVENVLVRRRGTVGVSRGVDNIILILSTVYGRGACFRAAAREPVQ